MSALAHRRRTPRGVTLIEGMVSLVVFSIGMLGVLKTDILTAQQNGLARRQSAANHIARDLVDAFERVPFSSALFPVSTLSTSSAAFTDLTNTDGLRLLTDAVAASERPLMGAAQSIATADGTAASSAVGNVYMVGWRAAPDLDSSGATQAYRIVVMVRFRVPGGATKQVNLWTVKYNPAAVATTGAILEI